MKQPSIFEVYVNVTSQEQADRLKQVCINNELPIWDDLIAFELGISENWFEFTQDENEFLITVGNIVGETEFSKTEITESEFMELLKQYKDGK